MPLADFFGVISVYHLIKLVIINREVSCMRNDTMYGKAKLRGQNQKIENPATGKAEEIMEIIQSRCAEYQFTVEVLAAEAGISPTYLRELVQISYQMSPHELIETVRLREAIKLMSENNCTNLFKILRKVGYLHVKTFREAFEKRIGMTPSECVKLFNGGTDGKQLLNTLLKRLDVKNVR